LHHYLQVQQDLMWWDYLVVQLEWLLLLLLLPDKVQYQHLLHPVDLEEDLQVVCFLQQLEHQIHFLLLIHQLILLRSYHLLHHRLILYLKKLNLNHWCQHHQYNFQLLPLQL
tara:strand:+ start:166 stop:501 length:336 start_codon:yes stop_codon:yes gene_type:complete